MESPPQIHLWMGNNVPAHLRKVIGLPDLSGSEDPALAPEIKGAIIVFVAHVPGLVLNNPVYKEANCQSENSGWMREGECGLFGAIAIRTEPHPEGDGILLIGSAV